MKHILTVVAYLFAIIAALNLFNNGYIFETFAIVIVAVVTPILAAYFYTKNYSKPVGLSSKEVAEINKRLENPYDFSLQIEELNYIFKRDFNQTILQMRSDNKELFEKASLEIASL